MYARCTSLLQGYWRITKNLKRTQKQEERGQLKHLVGNLLSSILSWSQGLGNGLLTKNRVLCWVAPAIVSIRAELTSFLWTACYLNWLQHSLGASPSHCKIIGKSGCPSHMPGSVFQWMAVLVVVVVPTLCYHSIRQAMSLYQGDQTQCTAQCLQTYRPSASITGLNTFQRIADWVHTHDSQEGK